MLTAQNEHNLEDFATCFAPDYGSEQPVHPSAAFVGREQVRKNWAAIFAGVPDFQAELLGSAVAGDTGLKETVWAEWHLRGTWRDGTALELRGVTIFEIQGEQIAWARLYMESVQPSNVDIDAQVQNRVQGGEP